MFIQVVQGRTTDGPALRAAVDRWLEELAPGAAGWLGSTAGVTPDGRFIAVVRFDSEQAARRNSDRPEQTEWWNRTSKLLSDVAFHDCADVQTVLDGGSDEAGFVQVIQGRARDVDRLKELMAQGEAQLRENRPDILDITGAYSDDGTATQTIYFRSETEARDYERRERPEEVQARLDEMSAFLEGLDYLDLPDPWLASPR